MAWLSSLGWFEYFRRFWVFFIIKQNHRCAYWSGRWVYFYMKRIWSVLGRWSMHSVTLTVLNMSLCSSLGVMCVERSSSRRLCSGGMWRRPPMERRAELSRTWKGSVNTAAGNSLSSESIAATWTTIKVNSCWHVNKTVICVTYHLCKKNWKINKCLHIHCNEEAIVCIYDFMNLNNGSAPASLWCFMAVYLHTVTEWSDLWSNNICLPNV